ncbi:hypothetical protein GCM10011507_00950 [Edaphobacter acidisoli]|uniref:Glycoside hydrolase n=2 Tax=Edaphobacter acidisoli TaxID=2040573 RepID=A0A916RH27_9BACT|nr:hypothetical protein GCM10011507_00950 [Edaphobacter acidisoli]
MFKCHFDAGFINTQAAVVNKYFTEYFPHAIQVAEQLRNSGTERYVWTTGSWLLYEYLEQASAEDRRRMEQAIARGDIAWHALPFNWQTEMLDRSMIEGSFALSHALDSRFGRTTTGAKMTDVPGHTRGLVAPMAAHGVKFLDIGVNDASTPAEVPALFNWKDSGGSLLTVMYHHGYGGVAVVPGSDLAIAIVVRGDNSGPHTPSEIAKTYSELNARFPDAQVVPTSLTEIANAVSPYRKNLPVVTQEIGDTWIYGCSSDPLKVARYREVARLRQAWIAQGKLRSGDATDLALLRSVLLEAEHTWGTDTKTWLDFDHYTPGDLAPMLDTKNYKVVEFSWEEKRKDLFDGLDTLPAALRDEAYAAVHGLDVKEPQLANATSVRAGKSIETEHFIVALDSKTGAIHRLYNKQAKREWASREHPLALFSYQTLSQQDYTKFFSNYVTSTADWAKKDFGKPNIERFGAQSRIWLPELAETQTSEDEQAHRLLARLEIHDAAAIQSGAAAFPQEMYLELIFPKAEPALHLNFYCLHKPATRMPESLWLTFNPIVADQHGWMFDKSGEAVSPFDVVATGNRHMHAVTKGFQHKDSFTVETLDAPLVALGEKSPLNFSRSQPDLSDGVHSNLFNNAWGTNYIMWYGEDMRFRYVLRA